MPIIGERGLSDITWTSARAGYLDNINQAGLLQLTAARAGYLDLLNTYLDAAISGRAPDLSGMTIAVYPGGAGPLTINTPVTAWNWSSYTEIIAANAITNDFYIVGADIEIEDGSRDFQVAIAKGAAGSEINIVWIGRARPPGVNANNYPGPPSFNVPIKVAANSRISVTVTDNEAAANEIATYVFVAK